MKEVSFITPFEVQDIVFREFTHDLSLMSRLGNPLDDESKNTRFRRAAATPLANSDEQLPFVSIVFRPEKPEVENYFRNNTTLEICIYTTTRNEAAAVYKEITRVLQARFSDMPIITEGQKHAEPWNVFQYSIRYKPLVNN
jgi:hypothetical protein